MRKPLEMALLFVLLPCSLVNAGSSVTLQQCYEAALKQSEQLQINQESIRQFQSRYLQARARALPDLNWKYDYLTQDTSGTNDQNGFGQNFTQKHQTNSRFNIIQPIYGGFKEFAAMASALNEKKRDELLYARARTALYGDVASVFYTVVAYESDLKNVRTNIDLTRERVSELKSRVRLGKSRASEVQSSEAQYENLLAQEKEFIGQSANSRADLAFLTGVPMDDAVLIDQAAAPATQISLEEALKKSQSREDVRAFQADMEAKRKAIRVYQADYQPDVDVEGNYYTHRASPYLEKIDWDVLLKINVPIFQGGQTSGETDEARSIYRQSILQAQQLARQVQTDVMKAHTTLKTSVGKSDNLGRAYDKARSSYQGLVREYRLGLVNNLEVLQAQNVMQQTKHDYDRAVLDSKLNALTLNVVLGEPL